MNTITIEEISALSKLGRIAVRHAAEFGQTEVGAHCAIGAERRVVVEVSPTGVGYIEDSPITIYPVRGAGDGRVFCDPSSGRIWWGAMTTLRALESDSPLEGASVIIDAENAAYQKAVLSGAA